MITLGIRISAKMDVIAGGKEVNNKNQYVSITI